MTNQLGKIEWTANALKWAEKLELSHEMKLQIETYAIAHLDSQVNGLTVCEVYKQNLKAGKL